MIELKILKNLIKKCSLTKLFEHLTTLILPIFHIFELKLISKFLLMICISNVCYMHKRHFHRFLRLIEFLSYWIKRHAVSLLLEQKTLAYGSTNHSAYQFGNNPILKNCSFGISSPEHISAFSSVNDPDHGNIIPQV